MSYPIYTIMIVCFATRQNIRGNVRVRELTFAYSCGVHLNTRSRLQWRDEQRAYCLRLTTRALAPGAVFRARVQMDTARVLSGNSRQHSCTEYFDE